MTLGTTVDAVIERARRDATLASRGAVYTVGSGGYTAGATTLVLNETPSHIGQGSILAVDYELFYVQSLSASTKTVTVIPGYQGTSQASHAANAIVEVDSRFPKAAFLDYAAQEIQSWGTQLFRVTAVNLDVSRENRIFDLAGVTGEVYFLLDVRVKPTGVVTNYWNFSWTRDAWPHADARLLRQMDTGEYASGIAIQLRQPPGHSTVARVILAQPFDLDPFTGSTDLVADVGLKAEWCDIVELGCHARAMSATAAGRADWRSGNMARNAEEVSVFDTLRAAQLAESRRDLRFANEATELRGEWPFRNGG